MGCWAAYELRAADFRALSGALTVHRPQEFMPGDYRGYLKSLSELYADSVKAQDDDSGLADFLAATASEHVQGCWSNSGRYWDVTVQFPARWNQTLRFGLCAPTPCEEEEVISQVAPAVVGDARKHLCGSCAVQIEAAELSHWARLSLDFAIVGVDSCGTSSLHRNLAQHPDVVFTSDEEDWLFYQYSVLPLRSKVEEFNAKWARRPGRRLGVTNPTFFADPVPRSALATMPATRVLLITCDLASRFEKYFWEHHFCQPGSRAPAGTPCHSSIEAALLEPGHFERRLVASHLAEAHALFGPRLLVLHQDDIRNTPHSAYRDIAAFIGAGPYPSGTRFQRYNSLGGHRTDLCRNASLLRRLKRRLAAEYAALDWLLQLAGYPTEPWVTRCERPSELDERAPSCDRNSPCAASAPGA